MIIEKVEQKENIVENNEDDEEKHAKKLHKHTEQETLNTISAMKNDFRQQTNITDEIKRNFTFHRHY